MVRFLSTSIAVPLFHRFVLPAARLTEMLRVTSFTSFTIPVILASDHTWALRWTQLRFCIDARVSENHSSYFSGSEPSKGVLTLQDAVQSIVQDISCFQRPGLVVS